MLRREAGFSIRLAEEKVRALPQKKDGARQKVKLADLQRIVKEANQPTPVVAHDAPRIRGFQKRLKAQIRRSAGLEV